MTSVPQGNYGRSFLLLELASHRAPEADQFNVCFTASVKTHVGMWNWNFLRGKCSSECNIAVNLFVRFCQNFYSLNFEIHFAYLGGHIQLNLLRWWPAENSWQKQPKGPYILIKGLILFEGDRFVVFGKVIKESTDL